MENPIYDAVIIGGGPGGSAAATYLSKAGKSVVVLEKEIFPRFHIGESLLPYNKRLFREMGVLDKLERQDFPRKLGAQFLLGNGSKTLKFVFGQGRFTLEPEAFQVERSKFDHLLLDHAAESGAEVKQGWTVGKFRHGAGDVSVEARDESGLTRTFTGKFLIDASGRGNLTGNQEGLRVVHPNLRKLAVFGHFTNVKVDAGSAAGDTVIVRFANKWFWLIPISSEKVSVGCVMDQTEFAESKESPAEIFDRIWRSSPPMRERMERAVLVGPIRTTSDFSYYNTRYAGKRLLRVGDAAGFMDPIFSAGVYLAMHSGKMASDAILEALRKGSDGAAQLERYHRRLGQAMRFYWEMVMQFYTTPFLEVFFEPREKFQIASAINAALAGELDGGWKLRWRMRLFFWIVKAQGRLGFMPKISFE